MLFFCRLKAMIHQQMCNCRLHVSIACIFCNMPAVLHSLSSLFFSGHGSSLLVVYYLSSYAELAFFTKPMTKPNQYQHQHQHQHQRQCQRQRDQCFVVISHEKVCQMWKMVQKAAVQNWWPIQDWSGQVMTNKKTENSSCNKAARWLISSKMEKTEGSSTQFVCIKVCSTTGCPR